MIYIRTNTQRFEMRISYDDMELLNHRSLSCGITKSEYIRRLLHNKKIIEKPDDRFYELMTQLNDIEKSLYQIANKAEYLDEKDKEFYKEQSDIWSKFIVKVKRKYL